MADAGIGTQEPMTAQQRVSLVQPRPFPAVLEQIVAVGRDIVQRYHGRAASDNVRYASWEYRAISITLAEVEDAQAADPSVDRVRMAATAGQHAGRPVAAGHRPTRRAWLLSAAVWPVYKDIWEWWTAGDGYEGFCQDPVGWIGQQTADMISPMLYLSSITQDDAQFAALVQDFVERANGEHVVPGITATYDTFAPIGRRIDIARQAGAGQSIFAYGHVNQKRFWDFRNGPYATPAAVLIPQSSRERTSAMLGGVIILASLLVLRSRLRKSLGLRNEAGYRNLRRIHRLAATSEVLPASPTGDATVLSNQASSVTRSTTK